MARSTTSTGRLRFATLCAVVMPLLSQPNSNADSESVFGEENRHYFSSDLNQEIACSLQPAQVQVEYV